MPEHLTDGQAVQAIGKRPDGVEAQLTTNGLLAASMAPLAANAAYTPNAMPSGVQTDGWMDVSAMSGLQLFVSASHNGSYTFEWSEEATGNNRTLIRPLTTINYLAANTSRPSLFPRLASYLRLRYTNGATAQTSFVFTATGYTTPAQATMREAEEDIASTNLLTSVHALLSASDNTTNAPSKLKAINNGLRVYVDNQTAAPANQNVTVNNFPATQAVSGPLTDTQLRAAAVPVRDVFDAARTQLHLYVINTAAVTTEALLSLTPVKIFVTGTAATSYAVTAGKTLRLHELNVTVRNITTAAIVPVTFNLRVNTAGAVTATSPIVASVQVANPAAVLQTVGSGSIDLPLGVDIPAGAGVGLTHVSANTTNGTVSASLVGFEV